MERYKISVSYRLNGMRLDHAISDEIPGMSRRRAKAIIDVGGAYLNRKRIRVASKTVNKGDQIEVEYNPKLFEVKKAPVGIVPADILYYDHGVIVINKPAGMPSQPTRDQAIHHVIPALTDCLKTMGREEKNLQLVHRLDKDTTGCLVIATSKNIMTYLTEQFKAHEVKKVYHAVSSGLSERKSFEERCYLSSIQPASGRVKVMTSGGKSSQTFVKLVEAFPKVNVSFMECLPVTGRSHQIRVHLEKNNLPILGDKVYGEGKRHALPDELSAKVAHQLLHSRSISFSPLPGVPKVTVTAPYRQSMQETLDWLRANV